MSKSKRYSPEYRERAVGLSEQSRPGHRSRWAAIESAASKIGCTEETLRRWINQAEIDDGERADVSTDERRQVH